MLSKFTNVLLAGAVLVFALATPSGAQTAPAEQDQSPFVSTTLTPPSVLIGETSTVAVNFNNVPTGGFASAEFSCTYNPAMVEISAITPTDLFGADPITVINGPQNGSFVFAVAGSIGNKAASDGAVFTFSAKGLQVGQPVIDCQARASVGDLVLVTIPSTPASLDVIEDIPAPIKGIFTGQVHAGKPVTITLKDQNGSVSEAVVANPDGTFSLSAPAGTYTVVASAPGFLRAQGIVNITNGGTATLQTVSLLAGDIDGNDVIDNFDALTIGINYNGTEPAAADLSNDGTINVIELEILSPNYRQVGPLALSTGDSPNVTQTPPSTNPTNTGVPPVIATETGVPPTATTVPINASVELWHSPGAHGGLNAHEHGDKPPAWADEWNMASFGSPVIYGDDESTPNENVYKHQGFKGYLTRFNGGEQYSRFHMMTTPVGQVGIFHSFEIYMRDPHGNVTFLQGWIDFAQGSALSANNSTENYFQYPDGCVDPNYPFMHAGNPEGRPRIITNTAYCFSSLGRVNFESWYSDFHPLLPTTGINSEDTYFFEGDATNPLTWTEIGTLGLTRRIEISWSPSGLPVGWFYADQFGRIMSGEDDVRCGQNVNAHGQQHVVKCLPQYIAPTATSFGFPGNDLQKLFPGSSIVTLPN